MTLWVTLELSSCDISEINIPQYIHHFHIISIRPVGRIHSEEWA